MLAPFLVTCLALTTPQEPVPAALADAMAVRGDAELDPAAAFASARHRAEDHVRERWHQRAQRAWEGQRPFWLPDLLAKETMRRWLAELPVEQIVRLVDREDRERSHEFGSSYQTTLWVAEDPRAVQQGERQLRRELRQLEHITAIKYGGVVGGWVLLALMVGWIDRLSRGYMTGRLRLLGLLGGVAVPAIAFLV